MADDHKSAVIVAQTFLDSLDGVDVQMICGLVEDQERRRRRGDDIQRQKRVRDQTMYMERKRALRSEGALERVGL